MSLLSVLEQHLHLSREHKAKLRFLKPADEPLGIVLALEDNKKVLIHISTTEFISIFSSYFLIILEGYT